MKWKVSRLSTHLTCVLLQLITCGGLSGSSSRIISRILSFCLRLWSCFSYRTGRLLSSFWLREVVLRQIKNGRIFKDHLFVANLSSPSFLYKVCFIDWIAPPVRAIWSHWRIQVLPMNFISYIIGMVLFICDILSWLEGWSLRHWRLLNLVLNHVYFLSLSWCFFDNLNWLRKRKFVNIFESFFEFFCYKTT